MKFKKLAAVCAAMATMAAMSTSVSAADWSQTFFADNDPNTVEIVSTDANGVTFTNTVVNTDICKARITLNKILKNPADYEKINRMTWTVTYTGVSPELDAPSLSGGTWATNTNAKGFTIRAEVDEDENPIWDKDTYVVEDSVDWGIGGDVPDHPVEDGEMVFMDWSYADIAKHGITVTISDLKIFDADGNEIEQLGYKEYVKPEGEDEVTEAQPVETEAPVAEEETKDEPAVEEQPAETAPADDNVVGKDDASVETGNGGIFVAIGALAASAAALVATKKKED